MLLDSLNEKIINPGCLALNISSGHPFTRVEPFCENAAIFRYSGVNAADAANAVNLQTKRR